jgi:hypothetical protein
MCVVGRIISFHQTDVVSLIRFKKSKQKHKKRIVDWRRQSCPPAKRIFAKEEEQVVDYVPTSEDVK